MIVRRFLKDGGGASAVEFGLTAPVFLAALLGAIELGVMFWTQLGLQHAAERTARCASVNKTICGSETAIKTYAVSQVFRSHGAAVVVRGRAARVRLSGECQSRIPLHHRQFRRAGAAAASERVLSEMTMRRLLDPVRALAKSRSRAATCSNRIQ